MEEEEERARPTQVSKVIPVDHPSVLELARGVSGLVDKVFFFFFFLLLRIRAVGGEKKSCEPTI